MQTPALKIFSSTVLTVKIMKIKKERRIYEKVFKISYMIVRPARLANTSPIDWVNELWLTFLKGQ